MSGKEFIQYFSIMSRENMPGIYSKLEGVVEGFESCGYSSELIAEPPGGVVPYLNLFYKIVTSRADLIIVRYNTYFAVIMPIVYLLTRIHSTRVIVDVPTALTSLAREIRLNRETSLFRKSLSLFLLYSLGPLNLMFSDKVLQYSVESKYFSFLSKNKIFLIGNGVDVSSIKCVDSRPRWPNRTLNVIAVGTLAVWHGWDKLIEALPLLNVKTKFQVKLTIIGDGPELENLQRLARKNNVSNQVEFTGLIPKEKLREFYQNQHLAISSLGWSRTGVSVASPLKTREYLAYGLPVIYSTYDPDLDGTSCHCAFRLNDDCSVEEICGFFQNLDYSSVASISECRHFAEEELDFSKKVEIILK